MSKHTVQSQAVVVVVQGVVEDANDFQTALTN